MVWQWVRGEIYAAVVDAGYDDLNPAHVAAFRNPSMEGLRPGELAAEMQITKQSVNELLGHLERQGYLIREVDPTDSRSRRIHLTRRGRALERTTFQAAENAEHRAAVLIGKDRMQQLHSTLTDLVAQLDSTSNGQR